MLSNITPFASTLLPGIPRLNKVSPAPAAAQSQKPCAGYSEWPRFWSPKGIS